MLLAGAGLLIRSFIRVQTTNRGFDSSNVLLLQVDLPGTYDNPPEAGGFLHRGHAAHARPARRPGRGRDHDFFIHRQPDYRIALEGQPPRRPDVPAPPLTED